MKYTHSSSMRIKTKSKKQAYRFWMLFGSHYAYLGKWVSQIILWTILFAWLPVVMFPEVGLFQQYLGIFAIGLPALGVLVMLIDLLFIPYYVKKYNEKLFANQVKEKEKVEEVIDIQEENQIGYPITY